MSKHGEDFPKKHQPHPEPEIIILPNDDQPVIHGSEFPIDEGANEKVEPTEKARLVPPPPKKQIMSKDPDQKNSGLTETQKLAFEQKLVLANEERQKILNRKCHTHAGKLIKESHGKILEENKDVEIKARIVPQQPPIKK